jgi:ComF family protein
MQLPENLAASGSMLNATASHFCEACRKGVTRIGSPVCSKCGLPFVSREGIDHTCSECLQEERPFRKARAFGVYDGSLMEAIHIFKYAKKASLSRPLSALVRETFLRFWDSDTIDLIVPVPLHVKRLRERGFNQSYLLIKRWAKQEGLPFDGALLSRHRWTEPQTTLSRKERQRNIKGAFAARKPDRTKDKRILLVDDVYTTGATVTACAQVLLEACAESVDILTLARAV